MMGN